LEILVENIGKRFGRNWIFRNFNYHFQEGKKYAIIGNNGSGKSTLLKILAGIMPPTTGTICYTHNGAKIPDEQQYQHLAFTGPYMELIEEFNLVELLNFFANFRKIAVPQKDLITKLGFQAFADRRVKNYSSGMKQKLKLSLALFAESKIVMLDEPTSNFDEQNIQWYLREIDRHFPRKIIIICSNQKHEYNFCENRIDLKSFKY